MSAIAAKPGLSIHQMNPAGPALSLRPRHLLPLIVKRLVGLDCGKSAYSYTYTGLLFQG